MEWRDRWPSEKNYPRVMPLYYIIFPSMVFFFFFLRSVYSKYNAQPDDAGGTVIMLLLPSPTWGWPKTNDWGSEPPPKPYAVIWSSSSKPDRNNINSHRRSRNEKLFTGRAATSPSKWITAEVCKFIWNFLGYELIK